MRLLQDAPRRPSVSTCALLTALLLAAVGARLEGQNQALGLTGPPAAYVQVPHANELVPTCGITVEAWVNYDPAGIPMVGTTYPTVVRKNPAANAESYNLRLNTGQLQWVINPAGGGLLTITDAVPFPALTWTHVAGTFDGTTSRLFINGTQVQMGFYLGGATVITNTGGDLRIGTGDNVNPETWSGQIDEVRIWRFARDGAELSTSMGQGIDAFPGVVASWRLDGSYFDSAGSNHGTPSGSLSFVPSPVTLTTVLPTAGNIYGPASPTGAPCIPATLGMSSVPGIGNVNFAFVGCDLPPSAAGILGISDAGVSSPLVAGTADIWVDILSPAAFLIPVTSTALGVVRIAIAIPGDPALIGVPVFVQTAWANTCTVGGISASDALLVVIQP